MEVMAYGAWGRAHKASLLTPKREAKDSFNYRPISRLNLFSTGSFFSVILARIYIYIYLHTSLLLPPSTQPALGSSSVVMLRGERKLKVYMRQRRCQGGTGRDQNRRQGLLHQPGLTLDLYFRSFRRTKHTSTGCDRRAIVSISK